MNAMFVKSCKDIYKFFNTNPNLNPTVPNPNPTVPNPKLLSSSPNN